MMVHFGPVKEKLYKSLQIGREGVPMSVVILNSELDFDVPCRSYRHNERFLEVVGVTDLRHFFY